MDKSIEQMNFKEGKLFVKMGEDLKNKKGDEWVVCKFGSVVGVQFYKCVGTKEDAKEKIVQLVIEDKNDRENEWEKGTDDVSKVTTLDCKGEILVGKGEYHFYSIAYFAGRIDTLNKL